MTLDLFNDRGDNGGNKLRTYRTFKTGIYDERYLNLVKDKYMRINICKLRISAHNLPIEIGRHHRPRKIPVEMRKCELCKLDCIGDEFHLIMQCDKFSIQRHMFMEKLRLQTPSFENMNISEKFITIMRMDNDTLIINFNTFLRNILMIRGEL